MRENRAFLAQWLQPQALQRLGSPTRGAAGTAVQQGMPRRLQGRNPQKTCRRTRPPCTRPSPRVPKGPSPPCMAVALVPHRQPAAPGRPPDPHQPSTACVLTQWYSRGCERGTLAQRSSGRSATGLRKAPTGPRSAPANAATKAVALQPCSSKLSAGGLGPWHPAKGNGLAIEAESKASRPHTDFCPNQAAW